MKVSEMTVENQKNRFKNGRLSDKFKAFSHINNEGRWRIKVLKRDNYTCQLCGYKPARVVHHINSRNYYPSLKYDIDNGLTVCDACHKTYHRGNSK